MIETKVIYQGSRELCERAMNEDLKINSVNAELGSIEEVRMTQDEGPFWNLEVIYQIEFPDLATSLGDDAEAPGTSTGPTYSELACRSMSRDLEEHSSYRKNWNNDFWSTKPYSSSNFPTGTWTNATAKNDMITNTRYAWTGGDAVPSASYYFAWGQGPSDLPSLPSPYVWIKVKERTKPGVTSFTYPVYELTEKSKHTSKEKAGWAVGKRAGRVSSPIKNDFGIVDKFGGSWLCEGGSVQRDGKYWVATLSYTHSPDINGWDTDIYPRA